MMTIEFDVAVNYILKNEGGLNESVKDRDPGGITNFGISLRFLRSIPTENLRRYGIYFGETIEEDDVRHLTVDQAKALYKGEFWDHAPFDKLANQNLVNYLFDMAVNMGISPAIKCLQRSCWAIKKDRTVIHDDGILGPLSLSTIHECGFYILPVLRAERASYYKLIAEQHPNQFEFLDGWLNRTYNEDR